MSKMNHKPKFDCELDELLYEPPVDSLLAELKRLYTDDTGFMKTLVYEDDPFQKLIAKSFIVSGRYHPVPVVLGDDDETD